MDDSIIMPVKRSEKGIFLLTKFDLIDTYIG